LNITSKFISTYSSVLFNDIRSAIYAGAKKTKLSFRAKQEI